MTLWKEAHEMSRRCGGRRNFPLQNGNRIERRDESALTPEEIPGIDEFHRSH